MHLVLAHTLYSVDAQLPGIWQVLRSWGLRGIAKVLALSSRHWVAAAGRAAPDCADEDPFSDMSRYGEVGHQPTLARLVPLLLASSCKLR